MTDRYRLVRPLTTGGMAELFLGIAQGAEGFEKPVAIKRMLPHLAQDEALVRMFVSEARLATHLHHQNIATVYDVGTNAAGLFLVMELVDGWDLGVLMRHAARQGQRFPPHLVAFIGAQVLGGLIHAYRRTHQGKAVLTAHRDISPSNLLISREGEVKVTDFGIARLEGVSQGTLPGVFKGKPAYASPETVSGQPATAASDQFSLGIILHELLSGTHPYSTAMDSLTVAMAIATSEPFGLPGVPEPLAEIVFRALAKTPEARFPQPEAMAEALARYLSRAGEPATSHALAAFIAGLNPPLTLLERGAAGAIAAAPPPELSGGFEIAIDAPAPSASASLPPRHLTPKSLKALSHSETMPGTRSAPPPPPPPAAEPPPLLAEPSPVEAPPEKLELVERTSAPPSAPPGVRAVEPTWEPPPSRAPSRRWPLVLVGVAALGAVGVLGLPYLQQLAPGLVPSDTVIISLPPLSIQSQPAGARVVVDGEDKGTTPLMMDNAYPPGPIPVQLTLPGYKPWKGTFTGGEPAQLDVRLQKR